MKNGDKTQEQLMNELAAMRQRVIDLEGSEMEGKRAEEAPHGSEEDARQLACENATIAEIGRIISSTLDIDEVYEHFAGEARKLIPFDRLNVNLIDHGARTAISAYSAGTAVKGRHLGEIFPLAGSAAEEVMRTRSGLLLHSEDKAELERRFPGLVPSFQVGHRSMIAVPLISKDKVIGNLYFGSTQPRTMTDRHLKLAEHIGAQIAGAIANAQLFTERKQMEEALRSSEKEASRLAWENAVVAEIGRIISSTLDIEKVYERFTEELHQLIPGDRTVFTLIHSGDGAATLAYVTGMEIPEHRAGMVFPLVGSMMGKVVEAKKGLIVETEDEKEVALQSPAFLPAFRAGIRSVMAIPLISGGQVIAVLTLQSMKRNAYTDRDLRIAQRVGNQIAGAIASAQLWAERKRTEEEKEKLQAQLLQAQKMESIGRLAGGVAHDFNNMLGVIMGRVEMALEHLDASEPLHCTLQEIQKAVLRSADLTRQLLAFARKQAISPKVLDLGETLLGMLKMLQRLIGEDIELVWVKGPELWKVKIDPSQIDQILANLAVNARDAISGTGSVTLRTNNIVLDVAYCADHPGWVAGEYVLLTVSDTGSGMARDVLDHVFEPFFTTKEVGKGTGLGLATVYGIVKQNDGFIEVASEPGKGTVFKIYLPRAETEKTGDLEEEAEQELRRGTGTLLLVEDEEMILDLAQTILESLGYTVLAASTPQKAIHLAERHGGDICLLVTDVVMPGMNGRELAERIAAIKPGIKCLYMSGYTADVIGSEGILDQDIHYIQKPFRINDLAKAVREIFE